ncbi:hypothetical protein J6590_082015 [Homalodisca vitripennis]|nr:hypothetical protein J6590_082015 [Homalodisca vitripennis]
MHQSRDCGQLSIGRENLDAPIDRPRVRVTSAAYVGKQHGGLSEPGHKSQRLIERPLAASAAKRVFYMRVCQLSDTCSDMRTAALQRRHTVTELLT